MSKEKKIEDTADSKPENTQSSDGASNAEKPSITFDELGIHELVLKKIL